MGYDVAFASEAAEDLERLVESLPSWRRRVALDTVVESIVELAQDPLNAPTLTHNRPTWLIEFEVDGVRYAWAAIYQYSQDEKTIVITHVFRLLM